jgi:hypothetical protein
MEQGEHTGGSTRVFVPGEGDVGQHTIRFGKVIIPVASIDAVALTMRPRIVAPFLFGAVTLGAAAAAIAHAMADDYTTSGVVFAIVVAIGAAIAFLRPLENLLAIGTGGGRTYYVRSKDKEFLLKLAELIRRKLDLADPSLMARFSDANDEVEILGRTAPVRRIVS